MDWPRNPEGHEYAVWGNRTTLVAVKGKTVYTALLPVDQQLTEVDRPEHPNILKYGPLPPYDRARRAAPAPPLRRLVRTESGARLNE